MYYHVADTISDQGDALNVITRTFRHALLGNLSEAIHDEYTSYLFRCTELEQSPSTIDKWLSEQTNLDQVFPERDLAALYAHLRRLCEGDPTQSQLIALRRSLTKIAQQRLELDIVWRDGKIVFTE